MTTEFKHTDSLDTPLHKINHIFAKIQILSDGLLCIGDENKSNEVINLNTKALIKQIQAYQLAVTCYRDALII